MNLVEGIQGEMNRVRELRKQYVAIGSPGAFGCAGIDAEIRQGEKAIASGDVVEMIKAYNSLQGVTG